MIRVQVSEKDFIDLLRAIRTYQKRVRRMGR